MDDALTLELGGYEEKHFKKLAQDLLTLAHQHRRLLEGGQQLDVDDLLGRRLTGKTRLAIVNTQSLSDPGTVDFWVSQFLLAVDRWRAKNPSESLQAVFLFDEADLYLPAAGAVPATKGPMESLLKRARSAGLGLFLATQSPGDLDYRCRDQVLTWLVGRVKEPVAIAKLRPMLDRRPGAADKLAGQKAGEFYLVREGDVAPVATARNLIPTEQVPEDRILALARGG
jgi:DNA helicase HerA-like ATPase